MDKAVKFLGLSILVSAILISIVILFSTVYTNSMNRYKLRDVEGPAIVVDSKTGTVYYMYPEDSKIKSSKKELPN